MQFEQQVVLVTGASRGLGKAFAEYLGAAGARVAVNSTGTTEAGEQVTAAINAAGGEAQHFAGRVEDGAELVAGVVGAFGRLDAVIHNAGFVQDKTLRKMSRAQWDAVLEVHLSSAFSLSQAAWPHFAEAGGGSLVFISSSAALYGNFGQANYAAAKMGLYGLCRTITLEGAQEQIRANCLAPFGATEMNSANMPQT
ncbi:MAG: SDR family NAD(P)-dependent oxidoreductase, partial [Pseudomonadota bacterium]